MPTIELPSGLKGQIRHLTIKDGRWLTNKQLQRKGKMIDRILEECWQHTDDPGLYGEDANGKVDWSKILIGDRDYALIAIRHESWGTYELKLTCGVCDHRFVWDLDLDEMLREQGRPLSDVSKHTFKNGNRFTTKIKLDTERDVTFKLATGADSARAFNERRKARQRRRNRDDEPNQFVDAVKVRLVEVAGIERDQMDEWLESLPMHCLLAFIRAFDEQDCGVDTTVEYECPQCDARDEIDLPFDQGFFFPKLRR